MKPARILVLVIAIGAGGIAAWLASGSDPEPVAAPPPAPVVQIETVDVLVAGTDIGVGTLISAQELKWQMWPEIAAGPQFIRKNNRPDAIEQLAGSITRQAFAAGEPIREARLIKAHGSGYLAAILPQGMRAIAMEISPESGAGGFILPNDHVDIILTRRDLDAERIRDRDAERAPERVSGGEIHTSTTILSNLRVLAIDQTVEEKNGQRVVIGRTATIEVSPRQAETLARAKLMGQLILALRSITDFEGKEVAVDDAQDPRRGSKEVVVDDAQDPRRGINLVRFGITTMTTVR
jgi:pilus assembly protein CpaB